jgi:hypothetical protein
MVNYQVGQEVEFKSGMSITWHRGTIHSPWDADGWWRILPKREEDVLLVEETADGARVTVSNWAEMRPVSPLVLLAECADE